MKSKRDFLKNCGVLAVGSLILQRLPILTAFSIDHQIDRVGVQLFSIPKILEKDFAGTMKMLANIGFKEIEFYGPYSFSAKEDVER